MEYYIDEKCTIWNRTTFHSKDEFKRAISQIQETGDYDEPTSMTEELLYDTLEYMTVTDNFGWATKECMKDGELIYANGNH